VFFSSFSFCQELVSGQGESYSNASGTIDFSIGEPIISSGQDGTVGITQGFHQTKLTVEIIHIEEETTIQMSLYPNPTINSITLNIGSLDENLTFSLIDLNGKQLLNREIHSNTVKVDFSKYAVGSYLLHVSNNKKQVIKSFQILKTK
jgi:hypothetical protein